MTGKACIGTSGWNYKSWRDGFCSEGKAIKPLETAVRVSGALPPG
jgi:uncharacterized protein YecE (DUF72 family)